MNHDLLTFLLVLLVAGLIGGFVGAEWSSYERTFSTSGAVVAAVGTAVVLLGLGAFFDRQDQRRRKQNLPEDIRGVRDRPFTHQSFGRQFIRPVASSTPPAEDSTRRGTSTIDPVKVQTFVSVITRLGLINDPDRIGRYARTKLRTHNDPAIAALKAQRELLNVLLDTSRGDPSVMGSSIASSCFGLCELVVEGRISETVGREYFDSYIRVFERVDGLKMPFVEGPLDYDTSLEIAREALKAKGKR